MCQYHPRCKTDKHNPETVCPRTGRSGLSGSYSQEPEPIGLTASTPKQNTPRKTGGSTRPDDWPLPQGAFGVLALIGMWVLASNVMGETIDLPTFIAGLALVTIPAGATANLTYHCNAWIKDGTRRCRNPRNGITVRCQHHSGKLITYDLIAFLTGCITVVNFIIALHALQQAPSIDILPRLSVSKVQ